MRKRSIFYRLSMLICAVLIWTQTAFAYSTLLALGDSLSDNGNISRFTDGPIWVELLADILGVPLADIAYGGATTGYDNPAAGLTITGLAWQVDRVMQNPSLLSSGNSLITLWAGANDMLQTRSPFDGASNIGIALEELYFAGGRNFLVPNLPNIGNTPCFQSIPNAMIALEATSWTYAFNSSLFGTLQNFMKNHQDANVYLLDTFSIFEQYPVGSSEWGSLFWGDGFHPSSAGHALVFDAAIAQLNQVPEPTAMLIFCVGLAGLGMAARKKQ